MIYLIEFLNNTIKSFRSDLSHILIILIEISSWQWALFMFWALIIWRSSPSVKSKDPSLDWVENIRFAGRSLALFIGWQWLAKNLLKIFVFVCMSVTNLSSIKRGRIKGTFLSLLNDLRIDQYVLACNNGLFNFYARFS